MSVPREVECRCGHGHFTYFGVDGVVDVEQKCTWLDCECNSWQPWSVCTNCEQNDGEEECECGCHYTNVEVRFPWAFPQKQGVPPDYTKRAA